MHRAILSTLAYFDLFDFPLTSWEVWKYLYGMKAEYLSVLNALDEMLARGRIETQKGFYFLKGRGGLCNLRLHRYLIAEKKYQRAKSICKILSMIPFVRFIGIINTLSYSNAREESDIDILILVDQKRLWLARFIAVSFLSIFHFRPDGQRRANTICLNFFVTIDGMNFVSIALKPKDIHLAHIIMQMVPIYDENMFGEKFFQENIWAKEIFPNNFQMRLLRERAVHLGVFSRCVKKVLECILSLVPKNACDTVCKKIQMFIMPKILKDRANKDTRVVFNDHILKFHVKDRREEYRKLWLERINVLNTHE